MAVDGEVAVWPVVDLAAAVDHRCFDGSHAGRLLGAARAYLEDPGGFDPAA